MTKVVIEIEESTLKALQGVARPLVDTFDTVIVRLLGQSLHEIAANDALVESVSINGSVKPQHYPNDDPPNLTHTRVRRAQINGKAVPRAKWNQVLHLLYGNAAQGNEDVRYLESLTTARTVPGIKTDNGYKPIAGEVISLQGVDSNDAWRFIADIARKLNIPVTIEFEWRNKKAAAFPGKAGILSWPDPQHDAYMQSIASSLGEWSDAQDDQAYGNL